MRELGSGDIIFILASLRWTILLSIIALIGGGAGGMVVALSRTSEFRPLRLLAFGYIKVFQGTPLLLQLFLAFFVPGLFGASVSPWIAAAAGLSFHASAFLGEIWRGSIENVPRGQSEAAKALGMNYLSRTVYVVLPQAVKISIPPTIGFAVQLIKGTSLASIIGFVEITRAAQMVNNATFQPFLIFGIVAAAYFALCWPLSKLSQRLEVRLNRAER